MFPIIKTERLTLNQVELNDAEFILFQRSSPEVTKYIRREPYTKVEQAIAFIEMITQQFTEKQSYTWALRNPETNEMLGSICLWNFSEDRKTAEIGYDLHPNFQGKGFMNEAMQATINYGFNQLNLNQIEAFTSKYNETSKKLLTQNNFILNSNRKDEDNEDNFIFELSK
ncbi:ribosomal-protein-alanine N-acetyltransferase [Algoriella xinjiangensis]|uniref:Ribosomal-protein-alanine N-acetyltransferase n=1 Tax=Algoriella xinjiangensis TaxID=684065 RepID=A0A1I4WNK7_9FLAO|nr:GNAT family N-acetyltransferase [Algoriella xinjiangensis]SFN15368.1 ribosomal-protein-alanine N-acetyltransferase [Algoriella xinjiangensis]VDH16777.1 Putative ribosomal N-acetyltransferase YdaF [Algoriella xinjiangensis]